MFSLVQGFYEEFTYLPERKIALLGLESAGKSSILEWMKVLYAEKSSEAPSKPSSLKRIHPTVGLNVAKLRATNERLLVWDLGGAKALRSIWDRYVEDAEALIWVVDSADSEKMKESSEVLRSLVALPNLTHSPLLVFANKQDLDAAVDPVKISLALDLLTDAEKRPQCVQPSSAETGRGIAEGMEWLLKCMGGDAKIEIRIP